MKRVCGVRGAALGLVLFMAAPGMATAGEVMEAACRTSGGPGVPEGFCRCMQQVADRSLSLREQKLAAQFLRNPVRANRIKARNPKRHEAFWERYDTFQVALRRHCVGWGGNG